MITDQIEAATSAYDLDVVEAARRIAELGPRFAVVKGGLEFPGYDAESSPIRA